jgi:glutamate racemase
VDANASIGIFDSGYGGLTVFNKIQQALPLDNYVYLGDNARAPYGSRSFDLVYRFTLQAVERLFEENCRLIILACNTASAKALRTIQQRDLPRLAPDRRVLGVIRPTVEVLDNISRTKHVGILGTEGTISSGSYQIEINNLFPHIVVASEACPMWVPLVENGEFDSPGADYFVEKHIKNILRRDHLTDVLVLGCTHYPLLSDKIIKYIPDSVRLFPQGDRVAESLVDYLHRHPEIDSQLAKESQCRFLTTEDADKFASTASIFLPSRPIAEQIVLLP